MKIKDIIETGLVGDVSKRGAEYAQQEYPKWRKQRIIGQINGLHNDIFDIRRYHDYYSLWDGDVLVGCLKCEFINSEQIEDYPDYLIEDVWVHPDYRGQKLLSNVLWFLKSRLGHSSFMIGDFHSPDMQDVTKGLSRFDKRWYNLETGETIPYGKTDANSRYYSTSPTDWRFVIECYGNYQGFPMMLHEGSWMKSDYSIWVD